jgi:translation initiation factor IF-1
MAPRLRTAVSLASGESFAAEVMKVWGTVRQILPHATFRVALDNGHQVLAIVGGATWMHAWHVTLGDRVAVEVLSDDLGRGRITSRVR